MINVHFRNSQIASEGLPSLYFKSLKSAEGDWGGVKCPGCISAGMCFSWDESAAVGTKPPPGEEWSASV